MMQQWKFDWWLCVETDPHWHAGILRLSLYQLLCKADTLIVQSSWIWVSVVVLCANAAEKGRARCVCSILLENKTPADIRTNNNFIRFPFIRYLFREKTKHSLFFAAYKCWSNKSCCLLSMFVSKSKSFTDSVIIILQKHNRERKELEGSYCWLGRGLSCNPNQNIDELSSVG